MMEIKVNDLSHIFNGEIVRLDADGNLIIRIDNNEYILKLINSKDDYFEFIFDNSYHEIKVVESTTTELKILLDGYPMVLKKYSKLSEIIEKSAARAGGASQYNTIFSQIPGRVISISVNKGDHVQKGDNIVVLESMKMQVAIKSHKDGVIKELKVNEGQSISRNDVVAVLE